MNGITYLGPTECTHPIVVFKNGICKYLLRAGFT